MVNTKLVKCAYALSKKLNKTVDYKQLLTFSDKALSIIIDELRKEDEASTEIKQRPETDPGHNIRLGMACKLVVQTYIHNERKLEDKESFVKTVRKVYEFIKAAEESFKTPQGDL